MNNEQIKILYFLDGDKPKVTNVNDVDVFFECVTTDNCFHWVENGQSVKLPFEQCTIHLYRLEDALKVIPKKHLLHTDKFWLQKQLNLDFEHRTQRVNNLLINHNIWVDNECDGIKFIEA